MDFADGEIRFKTSIDFENTDLSEAVIHNLISGNIAIIDEFYNEIKEKSQNN